MSDPAIRAAREKAAEAVADLLHAGRPMAEDRQIAAAAVAAFLRALPDMGTVGVQRHGVPENLRMIAAAVEAEAGDA